MSNLLPDSARLWHALGWTMIHFLWTGTALWLLLALVRRAVRRRAPQARYTASLLALGSCALLACGLMSRIIVTGVLLNSAPAGYVGDIPAPVASTDERAAQMELAALQRLLLAPSTEEAAESASRSTDRLQALLPFMHAVAGWLPWLWLCGTPLIAALFGTGIIGTVRLRLGSRIVPDAAVHDLFARLQQALRISRKVTLTVSDQVASPLVIGVLRPMIVLPPSMLIGLPPEQIEMILLHELAHVRRWDNFFNLVQRVIEAALFYHPAVWWTSRWVRLEREHCCDAVVLSQGRDPQAYAETLASLALPELSPQYAVAAMANHQLVSRIRHILNVEEQGMRLTRSPFAWSGVLLLVAGGALAFGHLAGAQERSGDPPRADQPAASSDSDTYSADINYFYDLLVQQVQSEAPVSETGGEHEVQSLDVGLAYPVTDVDFTLALDTPAWSALQATGAPNVEQGGDNPHAWAPLTEDGQPEWLELEWQEPVRAAAILVYESFNPGALVRVTVNGDDIQETTIFDGADPVHVSDGKGVAILPVTVDSPVKYVRLEFDSPAVPGWNEVDAVGLVELVSGEVHWAVAAQASSTYADRTQLDHGDGLLSLEFVHSHQSAALCMHCHKDPHAENATPQQCPKLVRSLLLLRGDRRQRIETLKQELQRLEQEEAAEHQQQSILRETQSLLEHMAIEQLEQADSQRIQEYEEAYRRQLEAHERAQQAEEEAIRLRDLLKLLEVEAISQAQAEAEAARLQELQARDREAQQAEAAAAAAAEAEKQAQMQKLYELWRLNVANPTGEPIPALTDSDSANDPTGSQKLLEDLTRSVQQQQQAIERLAEILEALRMQLQPPDQAPPEQSPPEGSGAGTSDYEGDSNEAAAGLLNYVDEAQVQDSVNDAAFLRGFLLDIRGVPPSPEEIRAFLEDPSESKRQQLLEKLKELNLDLINDNGAGIPVEAEPSSN
jgi:beta-lactamase regulating signal transducer with metallopeptidase domain